jgi:hypothetical protein
VFLCLFVFVCVSERTLTLLLRGILLVCFQVLQQFLSSSIIISKREDMIESYLIGNRLFKFLSVVLPTHQDYFTPQPKLANLRVRSQNQLIELLEYMEELELMIDEMEYNSYILTDLTRKKNPKNQTNTSNNNESSDETWTTMPNTSQSSLEEEEEGNNFMRIHPEYQQMGQSTSKGPRNGDSQQDFVVDESIHARQSYHSRKSFRSQTSSDDFAQRVAAVVVANNHHHHQHNNNADTFTSHTKRSISSTSDHTSTVSFRQHVTNHFRDSNKSSSSMTTSPLSPPVYHHPKNSLVRKNKMKGSRVGADSKTTNHHSMVTWENSTFGEGADPFGAFDLQSTTTTSHIDLLLEDEPQSKTLSANQSPPKGSPTQRISSQNQRPGNASSFSLPKLKKQPPAAYPRALRMSAHPSLEDNVSANDAGSELSSGMFVPFEDQSTITGTSSQNLGPLVEFRSKIEERLERAAERQQQFSTCYDPSQFDNSSVVDLRPYGGDRRMKCQFRGCIRSLLDYP